MLRKRNEYPRMMTPRGVAIYPSLHEPDYKFKKATGEFHVRLRLDPDAPGLAELVAAAEEIRDAAYEAKKEQLTKEKKGALLKKLVKADILKVEEEQESGEPTGFVILRASLSYKIEIKNGPKAGEVFYKNPDVFDARGKQIKNVLDRDGRIVQVRLPKVGSGSELKLNVTIMDYETDGGTTIGAKFELNAAQIIKLVTGGQRDASGYGFGEEEGDAIDEVDGGSFEDESADGGFEATDSGGTDRDF